MSNLRYNPHGKCCFFQKSVFCIPKQYTFAGTLIIADESNLYRL